jgi:tetratricopeptide (TPR) repeat protein
LAIAANDTVVVNTVDIHYNLGLALDRTGQPAEAEKEYREAVRIAPDFFLAHYNLGILLARLGRREEAIEQFTITLRLKPEFPGSRQALQVLGANPQ